MKIMMNGLKIGCWYNTAEHVVYISKVITNTTQDFIFCPNLISTKEPKPSNLRLKHLCGDLHPFIKPIPVMDKQSYSCSSIYYKQLVFSREEKDNANLTQDETHKKLQHQ